MVLTISVVASACGGSDTTELDAAQERIDELAAQVEELSEQQEEVEAPTTTTTEAPKETTTTAAVVEEEVVVDEPEEAAPVEAEPEPEADPPAEALEPASVGGLAVANASLISSDMGADDVAAFLDDLVGPTEDISGTMARIDWRWPALSTVPDTEVISVKVDVRWNAFEDEWTQRSSIDFLTSADPQDVVVAYQAELASFLEGSRVSSSTSESDGVVVYLSRVDDFDLQAQTIDGGRTFVSITKSGVGDDGLVPDGMLEALSGIDADVLSPPDSIISEYSLWHFLGNPSVDIDHRFDTSTLDEVLAIRDEQVAAEGWTLDRELNETLIDYIRPGSSSRDVQISVAEISDFIIMRVDHNYG